MADKGISKRGKIGLAVFASAAIVTTKLFYDYLRKRKWGRFW